jgi:hypothetical protein
MKLITVLAGSLLLFLIIISNTNASCYDCQNIMKTINDCNEVNSYACANYYLPGASSPPPLFDCCGDARQLPSYRR